MFEQRKGAVLVVVLYKSYCSRQQGPTEFKVSNIRLEVEDYGLKFTKRVDNIVATISSNQSQHTQYSNEPIRLCGLW